MGRHIDALERSIDGVIPTSMRRAAEDRDTYDHALDRLKQAQATTKAEIMRAIDKFEIAATNIGYCLPIGSKFFDRSVGLGDATIGDAIDDTLNDAVHELRSKLQGDA